MIDIQNQYFITLEKRKEILQRALYSQPYFYKMEFPIDAGVAPNNLFSQTLGINRDFFITEYITNCSEVFENAAIGSQFDMSIYSGWNNSVYRWLANKKLFQSFIATAARFRTAVASWQFDDRQHETFPYHVRRNDKIYAELRNQNVTQHAGTVKLIIKGFSLLDNVYVAEKERRQLDDSLSREVEWEVFKIKVEPTALDRGKKSYILENDNRPRLILGFSSINLGQAAVANASQIDVTITEIARRLRLTDTEIPLEFIAPRFPLIADTHIYYLPMEYYFQPYSKLEFTINNTWLDNGHPAGAEIAILTRTI